MATSLDEQPPRPISADFTDVKKSFLDLIEECDNFPYRDKDPDLYDQHTQLYYHFQIAPCPRTQGFVLPSVAEVLRGIPGWELDDSGPIKTLTLLPPPPAEDSKPLHPETSTNLSEKASTQDAKELSESDIAKDADVAPEPSTKPVQEAVHDDREAAEKARTRIVDSTTRAMKATDHFQVLKNWRDEIYPIHDDKRELLCSMERAASPLFGIVTYGAHLTAYIKSKTSSGEDEMKIWVPRRAYHKSTYGGMLDQTVAGGLATGESPLECIAREAMEEASIPEELTRTRAKATGIVSYFHIRDERAGGETRLLQPECQYVFDLELKENEIELRPGDGEVAEFLLMTVDEVKIALSRGEFKPNCALVLLDFFIRHSIVTSDNEKDYADILSRLHRRLEFPLR